MKTEDLRIGNYVLISNHDALVKVASSPQRVCGITSENELEFHRKNPDDKIFKVPVVHCFGIPLSEEWLTKLGFTIVKYVPSTYSVVLGGFELCFGEAPECYNFLTLNNWHGKNEIKLELMYVHQVQNLYYILTGKELELKNDEPKNKQFN
ncbi:hypothetical protein [Draconibacterium mangrovi]|uniref:hypothetical protein n=1 Tax=Draconibacterium mangrovi TaxID=2697469 RepID=UPI0013D0DC39|nr:hypothetical protein [Draconibacterium mangrovi]